MEKKWTCLACAGVAGALVALIGCGNDPGAAGANGTRPPFGGTRDGGGTTGGSDSGARPRTPNPSNPLIAAIPGLWVATVIENRPVEPPCDCMELDVDDDRETSCDCASPFTVDASDPDCTKAFAAANVGCERERRCLTPIGPPGDACTFEVDAGAILGYKILDGDVLRANRPCRVIEMHGEFAGGCAEPSAAIGIEGRVLEGGRRMTFTETTLHRDPTGQERFSFEYVKIR